MVSPFGLDHDVIYVGLKCFRDLIGWTIEAYVDDIVVKSICSEFCEGLLKVGYDLVSPFGLDHDVVHVGLNGPPDEVPKTLEHTMLVCSPSVL